jgi:hypothetical protein
MRNAFQGMGQRNSSGLRSPRLPPRRICAGLALTTALLLAGCGSGGSNSPTVAPPPYAVTTQVTLALGSAANDRLAEYDVTFQGVTLTSQSGHTVTLLSAAQSAEFIHVNGASEPMLTVAVPQDTYTAATVTISSASATCLSLASAGGILANTFSDNGLVAGSVTVTVPKPITISGMGQGLLLNLQVSQSAQFSNCAGGPGTTYAFTPTFALSAFDLPSQEPTASSVLPTLSGQIVGFSSAPESLQLTLAQQSAPSAPIAVLIDANTVLQGFSTLNSGLPLGLMFALVQVDGSLQADGSVLASRISLADLTELDVQEGPILTVDSAVPYLTMYPLMEQGVDKRINVEIFDFSSASFRIGGQITNLSALPFTPSFTSANVVAGQNVYISSPAFNTVAPPNYNGVATTITLEPQTINGTIVATAMSGGFTVYTVQLAAYDLFPALAVQPGQTTRLGAPTTVHAYVDANTQQFSTAPPTNGAVLRFFGLVFNDGGTLRMDCERIDDGVAP